MNELFVTRINGDLLSDLLQTCLQKTISNDEGLPPLICVECTHHLIEAHRFRSLCLTSEEKFHQLLTDNSNLDFELKSDSFLSSGDDSFDEMDFEQPIVVDFVPPPHWQKTDNLEEIDSNVTKQNCVSTTFHEKDTQLNVPRSMELQCSNCHRNFATRLLLQQHLPLCSNQTFKCTMCSAAFSHKSGLYRHKSKAHGYTPQRRQYVRNGKAPGFIAHICRICGMRFYLYQHLLNHGRISHSDTEPVVQMECIYCKKIFYRMTQLRHHMKNHQTFRLSYSKLFDENSESSKQKLTNEMRTCRSKSNDTSNDSQENALEREAQYKCSCCNRIFPTIFCLRQHMVLCEKQAYKCTKCPGAFMHKTSLYRHKIKIHGYKPQRRLYNREEGDFMMQMCPICGMRFNLYQHLLNHARLIHRDMGPVVYMECIYCKEIFYRMAHLRRHLRSHHGSDKTGNVTSATKENSNGMLTPTFKRGVDRSRRQCFDCKRTFATSFILSRHLVKCAQLTLRCTKCPARFSYNNALQQHEMKIHGNVPHSKRSYKAHICSVCSMRFYDFSNLISHGQTAHRNSSIVQAECIYCKETFLKIRDLRRHMLTHINKHERHRCSECRRSFLYKGSLIRHLGMHNVSLEQHKMIVKPYKCDVCSKTFKTRGGLNGHKRRHNCDKSMTNNLNIHTIFEY